MYVCIYVYIYVRHAFGPRAPALRANVKAARLGLESSKVDVNRRLSVCISRGGIQSLKVDLNRGLSVCIIHVVVDGV